MEVTGGVLFALLIWMVLRSDQREQEAIFGHRTCGYCPLGVHWDRSQTRWVHDDGTINAPVGRYPNQTHRAHPGGTLS